MTVYVDDMQSVSCKNPHWRYQEHCHMLADTDEEMEAMARQLKLPKRWRHGDHYDLTRNKRVQALQKGAFAVSVRELVRIRKQRRTP